jgi:hypothetical protein
MPGSSKWSLSLRLPHQNPAYTSPLPLTCYKSHQSHSSKFYHSNNIWLRVFDNSVLRRIFGPKRDEVTREWRKLHNKKNNTVV